MHMVPVYYVSLGILQNKYLFMYIMSWIVFRIPQNNNVWFIGPLVLSNRPGFFVDIGL